MPEIASHVSLQFYLFPRLTSYDKQQVSFKHTNESDRLDMSPEFESKMVHTPLGPL
jgi:hypothetical protein